MKHKTAAVFTLLAGLTLLGACRREDDALAEPSPQVGTPYVLVVPQGLPPMEIPANNPLTVQGVALGRFLFYEERLSGDNGMSCASCHRQPHAFTDAMAVSKGIDSIAGTRSTMPLINLGYSHFFFWDGRAATLEDQILEPVKNPIEMHETWHNAMSKLQADAAYPALFQAAFGSSQIDSLMVAKAIAQFVRTMVSANSPFDKFKRGEGTIPPEAQQGFALFQLEGGAPGTLIPVQGSQPVIGQGGADCFHCHTDAAGLFTDEQFHNNALDSVFLDIGRAGVSNNPADMAKFKTPTLRNIMMTAPYMHDGRFASIDEVLDHYGDGGVPSATADPFMKFTSPDIDLGLSPEKRQQIIAFLNTLTDEEFLNDPAFEDPGPPVP